MKTTSDIIGNYRVNSHLGAQAHSTLQQLKNHGLAIAQIMDKGEDLDAAAIGDFQIVLGGISIHVLSIETALALNDLRTPDAKEAIESALVFSVAIGITLGNQPSVNQ